jgi:hypothetical protein
MSAGRFVLICGLVAIATAIGWFYLLAAIFIIFGLDFSESWEGVPVLILSALACSAAASAIVLMRRARAKKFAEAVIPSAPAEASFVDLLTLDRPERGMIDLFPNQRFTQGIAAGGAILILLRLGIDLVFGPSQILSAMASSTRDAGIFLIMVTAVTRLRKSLAFIIAAFYSLTALWMPLGALLALGKRDIFGMAAYCLATLAFGTLGCCWWTLANLQESDRFLLRAPYKAVFSKPAWESYMGLPPVFSFMQERRLRTFAATLLASLLFCLAFVAPLEPMSLYTSFEVMKFGSIVLERTLLLDATVLIGIVVISILFAVAANALLNSARRQMKLSIDELVKVDPRPPILFLRAFYDDQVVLPQPRYRWIARLMSFGLRPAPLDQLLLEEATPYGPVVALGNPRDRFPPYGAARGYFENRDWQQAVSDLARDARTIVLCVDETDSVFWEIGHIEGNDYLQKTLFVLPPRYVDAQQNRVVALRLIEHLRIADQSTRTDLAAAVARGNMVGLSVGNNRRVTLVTSTSFSRFAYLLLIRWFFRTRLVIET